MCKLLIATGMKLTKENNESFKKFILMATEELTAHDRDGFGYSAYSPTTGLFGERWLDVEKAWEKSKKAPGSVLLALGAMIDNVKLDSRYNSFGKKNLKDVKSIVLHGRFSTNSVSIENTHPFVDSPLSVAISHNGVITNHEKFKLANQVSTCDSESILNLYKEHSVKDDATNIEYLGMQLEGWYAVGAHHSDGTLDVFKESRSDLYVAHIPELGEQSVVFATTEEILYSACEEAKFKTPTCYKVNAGILTRFDVNGQVVSSSPFEYSKCIKVSYNWPGDYDDNGFVGDTNLTPAQSVKNKYEEQQRIQLKKNEEAYSDWLKQYSSPAVKGYEDKPELVEEVLGEDQDAIQQVIQDECGENDRDYSPYQRSVDRWFRKHPRRNRR